MLGPIGLGYSLYWPENLHSAVYKSQWGVAEVLRREVMFSHKWGTYINNANTKAQRTTLNVRGGGLGKGLWKATSGQGLANGIVSACQLCLPAQGQAIPNPGLECLGDLRPYPLPFSEDMVLVGFQCSGGWPHTCAFTGQHYLNLTGYKNRRICMC